MLQDLLFFQGQRKIKKLLPNNKRDYMAGKLKGLHAFLYKQHFNKQRQAEIGKKSSKSYATP